MNVRSLEESLIQSRVYTLVGLQGPAQILMFRLYSVELGLIQADVSEKAFKMLRKLYEFQPLRRNAGAFT